MRKLVLAVLVCALLIGARALVGCGAEGDTGESQLIASTGSVQGYVYCPAVARRQQADQEMTILDAPTTSDSLTPLQGAQVTLEGTSTTQTTNSEGMFTFSGVALTDEGGLDVGVAPPSTRTDLLPIVERVMVRHRARTGTAELPMPPSFDRTGVVVIPPGRVVPTGGTAQFRAAVIRPATTSGERVLARRAFMLPPEFVAWSATGVGSIDASTGIFSAGDTAGAAIITATATIPPDPANGRVEPIVLTGQARARVVDRARTAVATGTVTGNSEQPFVGALVMAAIFAEDAWRAIPGLAVVGTDGTYRLGGLPSQVQITLVCIYGTEEGQVATQSVTLVPGENTDINFQIAADVTQVTIDPVRGRLGRFVGHPERHHQ